ncbi:MAG: septum formation initiator family protein [Prevotellaceae bacterium]|nr:septum formation initiator family protein [Prevotellaceae bacterium]
MNKKVLKYCKNKYVVTIAVFLVWIFFFDQVSVPQWIKQKSDNRKIIEEIELFDKKAKILEQQIKFKNNKDSIEKFVRENYYMKRDNEVIYIFD